MEQRLGELSRAELSCAMLQVDPCKTIRNCVFETDRGAGEREVENQKWNQI